MLFKFWEMANHSHLYRDEASCASSGTSRPKMSEPEISGSVTSNPIPRTREAPFSSEKKYSQFTETISKTRAIVSGV